MTISKQTLKIVCLTTSLKLGGAERQLLGLAGVLRDAGADVEVLSYHSDLFYEDILSAAGLKYCLIEKEGSGGDVGLCRRIARHLEETGCEVLIAFLPGACTKACLVHRFYPHFRLIVSERNFSVRLRPHEYLRFALFREADKVVCNNYSQETLIRQNVPWLRAKLTTITNFVDLEKFCFMPPESCKKNKNLACSPVRTIVITARLCPRKNAAGLIKAVAALGKDGGLPPFRVDWYGDEGKGRYASRCRTLIRKLALENIFFIHPADPDTAPMYQKADIFCLPSFYEGTSNSLAEALSCGKMVVISDVGDNRRYVRSGINGFLFDPYDVSDMASALRRALSSGPSRFAEYGAVSRKMAETMLNRNDFGLRWLKILK